MAKKDQIKWNNKYQTTPELQKTREPNARFKNLLHTISKGKALDIACGTGKNSLYLAKLGFNVDALDISDVALEILKNKKNENITTKLVDLEEYKPEKNSYDLIVMTNYLDRKIIPFLLIGLKTEGILYIETYMHHKENTKPNSNPDFLLKKEELKNFITQNCKLIDYDEFDNDSDELYKMKKQSIIIQKI